MTTKNNRADVICLSNHKGGVAKTCSTTNIGAGLALLKHKCLIIDLDPQANLSLSLGIKALDKSIYGCLKEYYDLASATIEVQPNLFIVPAHLDLSGAEIELSAEAGREYILKELIERVRDQYDFILIDCPPSLGLLTINAFTAANKVIIPMQAEFLALQGLAKLIEVINKIKQRLNKNLTIEGILITRYDNRKILNRDVLKVVKKHFPNEIFKSKIRENVSLAEAPSQGNDIFRYNSKSNGALDYKSLCIELIKRGKKSNTTAKASHG